MQLDKKKPQKRGLIKDSETIHPHINQTWNGLAVYSTSHLGFQKAFPCSSRLDSPGYPGKNAIAASNGAAGFSSPNDKADSRRMRHFLRPSHTRGASFSMAGRGGDTFGYAGFLIAGLLTLPRARHPRLAAGSGFNPDKEATMPRFMRRALGAIRPTTPVLVATVTAPDLAALLVNFGKRTLQGFRPVVLSGEALA